jgi:jumonji domain-containing protein 7
MKDHWKEQLSNDTRDFWVDYQIRRIDNCSSLQFCKEAYSRYHPVILTGLVDDWSALHKWNEDYLAEKIKDRHVSVNLTLEGRADSVQLLEYENESKEFFLYPAEIQLSMKEFFHLLHDNEANATPIIPYLSQQNNNLRNEFPELLDDCNIQLPLVEVFDSTEPEAVNLWIGNEKSVSSIHKDHFENLYIVIQGEKTFTLFPPTDVGFFPEKTYPTIKYEPVYEEIGSQTTLKTLKLTRDGCPSESISWIPIDPNDYLEGNSDFMEKKSWPDHKLANPIVCTVKPGEILYIPAMWFHRVSQNELTIAVNMWYDQRFDFRYFQLHLSGSLLCLTFHFVKDMFSIIRFFN